VTRFLFDGGIGVHRTRILILVFGLFVGLLIPGYCWAFSDNSTLEVFSGQFVIRQETFQANGVYVCRPLPLDEKIMDILRNNNIYSLNAYVKWVSKNIMYAEDENGDEWLSPEETLERRYGDCEDYAFLNQAVLQVFGYQSKVIAMEGIDNSHAICVFKYKEIYYWIDNSTLKKTTAKSLAGLRRHLFKVYGYRKVFSLNFKDKDRERTTNISGYSFQ